MLYFLFFLWAGPVSGVLAGRYMLFHAVQLASFWVMFNITVLLG